MKSSELGLSKAPFAAKQDTAKPNTINPDDLTPDNWKSYDGMYPEQRGGFNKKDRSLWRKDRYNAAYGRFRDVNGDYRNKWGHILGPDNIPLAMMMETPPFPGKWANDPGSQFNPMDYPWLNVDFYDDRRPDKLHPFALPVFDDDWDENGIPDHNGNRTPIANLYEQSLQQAQQMQEQQHWRQGQPRQETTDHTLYNSIMPQATPSPLEA